MTKFFKLNEEQQKVEDLKEKLEQGQIKLEEYGADSGKVTLSLNMPFNQDEFNLLLGILTEITGEHVEGESRVVRSIIYGWHILADETGSEECFSTYKVGEKYYEKPNEYHIVTEIVELENPLSYLVKFDDGTSTRIFNPNQVFYESNLTGGSDAGE